MRAPKRRRISRSDSLANICPSNRRRPNPGDSSGAAQVVQENSVSLPRGDVPKAESQGRIFSLGSPVKERLSSEMRFGSKYVGGGFLKECFRCEGVIGEKDDIFMYRYDVGFEVLVPDFGSDALI